MATQIRNNEMVDVLSADFLRNTMPLVIHNGVGGFYEHAFMLGGTALTLVSSSSPYVVTEVLYYVAVVAGNTVAATTGTIEPDSSAEIFSDADAVIELRVTAAGAIEIERTAGTVTLNVKLRLDWI